MNATQILTCVLIILGLSSVITGCILGAIWAAQIKDKDDNE